MATKIEDLRSCLDGGCIIRRPKGMHTNGGCGCQRDLMRAFRMSQDPEWLSKYRWIVEALQFYQREYEKNEKKDET